MRHSLYVLIVLVGILVLTACGTLELGFEPTATPSSTPTVTPLPPPITKIVATETVSPTTAAATPTPALEPTASPTPAPSLTPPRQTPRLRIALVMDGNVWLWSQGEETRVLTAAGDVISVQISDDGQVVAFLRGLELWAVNSDGTDERVLVSIEDIAGMVEPGDPGVRLHRFDWVPGTHGVVYNTRLHVEVGLVPNDDLRLVDADTLEQRVLLPRGDGGEFTYSPDGRQIAIVRSGTIVLVDAQGGNRREVLTYTPPVTYSEFQYYAQPVWAADSGSLRVVLPPADPLAQPPQLATVWHLRTDGRAARLIASLAVKVGSQPAFSPDLTYVAYLEQAEDAELGSGEAGLLVADLEDGRTITYAASAYSLYGWAPDSQHLAFLTDPDLPRAMIGQLGSDPTPVYDDPGVATVDVRWIDASRYFFTAIAAEERRILLGEIGGPSTVVATVTGRSLIYDFAH